MDDYLPQQGSDLGKTGLPLLESAISVQQVPDTVLQDQLADSLQDALNNVSGVTPMFYLGGAYERFVVRGFTQSLGGYRNGVLQPFTRFHRVNTERVEVLKGPAGLEYGVSDPGGIINAVTYKPGPVDSFSLEQDIGSDDQYSTLLNFNKAVSESVTLRLDGSYTKDHGFRETGYAETWFVAPSMQFKLGDNTRVRLAFELDSGESAYDQGLLAQGESFNTAIPIDNSYSQADLLDDYDNRVYEIVVDQRLGDRWNAQFGYSYFRTDTYYRSLYAYADLQPADTEADRYAWFGPEDMDSYTAFATLRGTFETGSVRHEMVMGIQQFSMHLDAAASETYVDTVNIYTFDYADSAIDPTFYAAEPEGFISRQRDKTDHIFIQDSLFLGEHWILSLGVAFDKIERQLDSAYYSPLEHSRREDEDVSPRAGVLYRLNPDLSLFANYSTSFGPAFDYEPSTLNEPEEAEQVELGFKQEFHDGQSWLTLSLFELEKTNITVPGALPNTTESVGKARSRGVELDWIGQIGRDWSLIANYAYTDSKVLDDSRGTEGNWLPNVPRHKAGGWLRYDMPTIAGLALGGGVTYASRRYGDTDNSYYDDDYTQWDLFAAYRFEMGDADVVAQLNLQNITDETWFTMRSRWTNMPAEPFTVLSSIKVQF